MSAQTFRTPRTPLVGAGEIDLHRRDMTATFAADVTLATAQAHLAEIGQWLPIDGDLASTLGDLVSSNSTGPLRLGYGAWRDLLLGVQFYNGRDELITAGGRTVKNVAGYDLTKFMVGSAGVFGRLVTLTTRTYRRPSGAVLARYSPDVKILGGLIPTSLRPQWAMLTSDALLCGFLGDGRTIEYYSTTLPSSEPVEVLRRSVEDDIVDRATRWRVTGSLAARASVPPSELMKFTSALPTKSWVADAAFGIVLVSDLDEMGAREVEKRAGDVGGSVRFARSGPSPQPSPPSTRERENGRGDVWFSTNPVETQIIQRLKIAFDPDNSLKPLPGPIR